MAICSYERGEEWERFRQYPKLPDCSANQNVYFIDCWTGTVKRMRFQLDMGVTALTNDTKTKSSHFISYNKQQIHICSCYQ